LIYRILKILSLFFVFSLIVGASAFLTLTFIIKSENTLIVPNLMGKDVIYALQILTDLKLNIKVKGAEYSADIPKNHIIFQHPEPGDEIKTGRDVKIIISKGTETVLVPDLKGLPLQRAGILLEQKDLCHENTSFIHSKMYKKNLVISQTPSRGHTAKRGECVSLLVSMGVRKKAYPMPDLRGLLLDKAKGKLKTAGFSLGGIKTVSLEEHPVDMVVRQEPLSGYRIMEGGRVNLVINRPVNREEELLKRFSGTSIFRYRVNNGFLRKHIRVLVITYGMTVTLFDEFVKPGVEITLVIPFNPDATLFVYEDDLLLQTRAYNIREDEATMLLKIESSLVDLRFLNGDSDF